MQNRENNFNNKRNRQHRFVLCFVLLFFLSACGGGGSGSSTVSSSGTGAIAFSLAWEDTAAKQDAAGLVQPLDETELDCQDVGVTTVEAKVYDEIGTLLATGGPWPCDQHSGTIEGVAAGRHREVVILGNSGDTLIYRGEAADITVTDGGTTEIEKPIAAIKFVPSGLSPIDNSSFTGTGSGQASVTFNCSTTPGASTYHFLLATEPNFTSIQKDEPVVFPLTVSLNPGTYYWKVSVVDQHGNQGNWSETLSFTVTGTAVSFQDPNLEAAVREALNKPEGEFTTDELQTVTTLSAYSKNITNLNGIQNLGQLDFLDLDSNQISDLSPLQNLTQLTDLYLSENQISNITPLQNLTNLETLFLYGNQTSNISILQNLTQLTWLWLSDNQISDISPLQNLTQLTNLGLSNNQISDISPLQNLVQLIELDLDNNQISDITQLQNLTQLTWLELDNNQISDIGPLQNFTRLNDLDLDANQINDIRSLQNLTQLSTLYLSENQISNITPLQKLTQLTKLHLDINQISDITPLQNLTQLTELYLSDNCITDFSPVDHVTDVYGQDNQGTCTTDEEEGFSIEGLLHHQGTPMFQLTNVNPSFWIRNEDTGQTHPNHISHYDPNNGNYRIDNVPENAGISISFHIIGERVTLPGNYRVWTVWDSSMPSTYDIQIPILIHLLQPWDNSIITELGSDEYPVHNSTLNFEWESVEGASSYTVYISKYRDADHPDGYGQIESIVNTSIVETSYVIQLSQSERHEHYEFTVSAYGSSGRIGYFLRTAVWGYGWDYRFKIE